MAIVVDWGGKAKACIEIRISDPWTIEEFLSARMACYKLIHAVDYRVPLVMDFRKSTSAPPGILRHFVALRRAPHPRLGHIHILGRHPTLERLSKHLVEGVIDPDKSVIFIESKDEIVY